MRDKVQSICIVRLSALGDVLMLVPLVRALQDHFPTAKITWVIAEPAYALVADMEGIEFIVIDKPNHIRDYWHFKRQFQSRCFDVLLATQASFRANLLYACIRAKRKIGYDRLRAKDGHQWFVHETIAPGRDHTLEGFLKFAEPLGVTKPQIRWDLPIVPTDEAWAQAHLPLQNDQPVILVNPAASKPERSWPIERYVAVIQHLQAKWQAHIVLTGGPGKYDQHCGEQIQQVVPDVINLIGHTKPKQLLAVIRNATLLLCPDTGPSHMAAAVGTPVIALHAVTSADVSGPYPFRHLCVDYYPEAVITILKKTSATNIWGTHAHGMETMKLVPIAAVIAKLDQFLSNMHQ